MVRTIREEDPGTPDLRAILEAHLSLMRATSPPEAVHALDLDELRGPSITFVALRADGEALGVGALKHLDARQGELKSMHTLAARRGQGIGAAILDHLIALARSEGLTRLSLETGATEPFHPAHALYRSRGFEPCGPFADYPEHPFSTFMTRTI